MRSAHPVPTPRFGVWALVEGTWGSRHHPEEPEDASWERNRDQILLAEDLGYDATLLAQHTYGPMDRLEAWTASAAAAALTERIEIITAIKPGLYHPVFLAKMALGIEAISGGRFAINFVNAFLKPEMLRAGLPFPDDDERYVYGREWLEIVAELMRGEHVTHRGPYFEIDDYFLLPADRHRDRPTIYMGGESEPARALAADAADVLFINGQPLADVAALIEDVRARVATSKTMRFGLAAFVIAREDEAEAREAIDYAWQLDELDRPNYEAFLKDVDEKAVMFQTFRDNRHIGTNGGTAAGLTGTYDEVAERIVEFNRAGIETFMLQFQPFEAEMRRFAEKVIPRVRAALG